ncbi:hypothetical protein ACHAWC_006868 [Mediolabrus comicus]
MDSNNDDEIISRRQDELDALQAFYGHQLRSSLSSNDDSTHDAQKEANDDTISVNGPWFIELIDVSSITMNNDNSTIIQKSLLVPTLEINLPLHYPSSQALHPPTPKLHNVNESHLTLTQQQLLLDELIEMYEPDMDVAIMWAERCRMEFVDVDLTVFTASAGDDKTRGDGKDDLPTTTTNRTTTTTNENNDKSNNHHYHPAVTTDTTNKQSQQKQPLRRSLCIRFLTFNHLLHGKSHRKESQLVALASKCGLIGLIVYGTPGVIGLLSTLDDDNNNDNHHNLDDGSRVATISTTMEDIIDFTKECNRIGKRATLLDYTLYIIANNNEDDGRLVVSSSSTMNGVGQQNKNKNGGMRSTEKSSKTNNKKKGTNKKNNKSNFTDYPSTSSSTATTLPLLSNLLGLDDDDTSISSMKAGLRHYDSFAELKEVLPESTIQSILGL